MVSRKKIKESDKKKLVKCIECQHSDCVRWHKNPVISICRVRKSFGEPFRMVANSTHMCESYARFNGIIKPIEQKQ